MHHSNNNKNNTNTPERFDTSATAVKALWSRPDFDPSIPFDELQSTYGLTYRQVDLYTRSVKRLSILLGISTNTLLQSIKREEVPDFGTILALAESYIAPITRSNFSTKQYEEHAANRQALFIVIRNHLVSETRDTPRLDMKALTSSFGLPFKIGFSALRALMLIRKNRIDISKVETEADANALVSRIAANCIPLRI